MENITTGVMKKTVDHTVFQMITRPKKTYGRKIVILDYENEKPVSKLEVMIRIAGDISYHMSDGDGMIDTVFTEKNDEDIVVDISSFATE
ncbi:hypothetical protein CJH55_11580 [Salmonella enterica]|nr:hypothetical protein [Salmonella enterica]